MARKTNWIDRIMNEYFPRCTRTEALHAASALSPRLIPESRWAEDEREFAAEHRLGEWVADLCPACGAGFFRWGSPRLVGCPACEPGALENRR